MKEFEWFEWFGPSPIEPFNPGTDMAAAPPTADDTAAADDAAPAPLDDTKAAALALGQN